MKHEKYLCAAVGLLFPALVYMAAYLSNPNNLFYVG
jgi:hypothetical protein